MESFFFVNRKLLFYVDRGVEGGGKFEVDPHVLVWFFGQGQLVQIVGVAIT